MNSDLISAVGITGTFVPNCNKNNIWHQLGQWHTIISTLQVTQTDGVTHTLAVTVYWPSGWRFYPTVCKLIINIYFRGMIFTWNHIFLWLYKTLQSSITDTSGLHESQETSILAKCHYSSEEAGSLQRPWAFFPLHAVSSAHRPWDTQRQYKQSHIMDSHNKLTLGSGWCSTQLMPVLIRAWKYYLGLAARSKKSILSQVINSALSDCSPIPGSSMSLSWLLPLKFSLWLALSR